MAEETLLKQAQYLFTTSRLIRSHLSKINADRVKNSRVGTDYQNLTVAQHAAIMIIDERGPSTIKALAEALGISAPSASAMVDKLVSKGVLDREQSRQDRREVRVSISAASAKKIEMFKQLALEAYVDLIRKAGPQTVRKWCEVVEAIQAVVEADMGIRPAKNVPGGDNQGA